MNEGKLSTRLIFSFSSIYFYSSATMFSLSSILKIGLKVTQRKLRNNVKINSHKSYSYVNMIQDHKEKLQKAIILTITVTFIDKLSRTAKIDILTLLKEKAYSRVHNTRSRREAF